MKIDKFLGIENKYNLYNKEIEGVNFWLYERFWIWNYKICSAKLNLMAPQSIGKHGFLGNIKTAVTLMYNSAFHGKIAKKKAYDVCFVAHERRCKTEEHYECIYTEALSKYYKNSITLESPFELKHFKPVINKELIYTDYILVEGELYSLINIKLNTRLYKRIYGKVKSETENAVKEIIEEYHVDIIPEEIYKILVKRILTVKVCRDKYARLIQKINPKLIVEVVHYNAQNMMINETAEHLGIKTIELQHGTMHNVHAAYQYGTNAHIKQLPDIILTFSDYWNKVINMPADSTKVIATGFPYFEEKVNRYKSKQLIEKKVKNILFLSQGTIGKKLFDLALELERIIDKTQYHIIYKLHPSEYSDWKERYGYDCVSEIEIIDTLTVNLYELFSKCEIQVGVYSTAIYEGMGFGLNTYIYNIAHADTMRKLADEKYAIFFDNAEELKKYIIFQGKTDISPKEAFWKTNAMENIKNVLNECLK